jgi:hypothetical protein
MLTATAMADDDGDRIPNTLRGRLLFEKARARALQARLQLVERQLEDLRESRLDANKCSQCGRPF